MNRWTLGLLIAGLVVLVANGILIKLALDNAPEIEPSYENSRR